MKAKTITVSMLFSIAAMFYAQGAMCAVDAVAAEALAKKEGCLKCHGIDKAKQAKSLTDIAKKFKGKADADAKILAQITSGAKVKFEDGSEEEHKVIKTKDKAETANLIGWIRSLAK